VGRLRQYYADLPGIGASATYVEGFRNGRTIMLAADAAARSGVPIVAIKVGRSDAGAKMASAHTGHLAGDLYGLVLYTLSGGTTTHLADLCGAFRVPVPRLEERTIKVLAQHIPPILRFDNPIDTASTLRALPVGRATLEAVVENENTSMIVLPVTGVFPGMIEPRARDIAELSSGGHKPILVIWALPIRDNEGYQLCEHGGDRRRRTHRAGGEDIMNDSIWEIHQALARLAHLADEGEVADYLKLFTEDAVWEVPAIGGTGVQASRRTGRADIADGVTARRASGMQGPGSGTRHVVHTIAVQPGPGDTTATSVAYYTFYQETTSAPVLATIGRYDDTWKLTAEGWKLAHRRITNG
jgi:3-phenylpropionate/cinnamic acid dioxygenase small subunit